MLPLIRSEEKNRLSRWLRARNPCDPATLKTVSRILDAVRRNGDAALVRLTLRYDRVDLRKTGFTVSGDEIRRARARVGRDFLAALRDSARNIRAVARSQAPKAWSVSTRPGVTVGQTVRPLDCVACYIPGGRFPLPSTVLMSAIPAMVAGVREICLTNPKPADAVLAASSEIGVRTVFRLGGAQAIAAFAFGTESVPRADKVVGPGNRFVAAAKKLVAGECGIDFVAGPSELVVVGAEGPPGWIAADMVAQAEHDPDASAILITPSIRLARQVQRCAARILAELKLPVAEAALSSRGAVIVTPGLEEAVEWANELAPEHLTLLDDAVGHLDQVRAAGAVFLGKYSPVAAGDYASGGNHILPTAGAARARGGLTAADFVRTISVQRLSGRGLLGLKDTIVRLADAEGLKAHSYSIRARFADDPPAQGR